MVDRLTVVLHAMLFVTLSWSAVRGPVWLRRGNAMLALYASLMLRNAFHKHSVFSTGPLAPLRAGRS